MITSMILHSWFAGITVFIGGLFANYFNKHMQNRPIKYEITHTMMSFGAGVILSAVAFVLVPKGMEALRLPRIIFYFLLGTFAFLLLDQYLSKKGGQTATLLAMMLDFIPESIALGAVFAIDPSTATLLAIFIGLQNLPEAFSSYSDMVSNGFTPRKTLVILFILSFFGIASALIGHYLLSDAPKLTARMMVFASGGILYLLVQDIIPASKLQKNHLVSMGAALGFLVGVIGEKII